MRLTTLLLSLGLAACYQPGDLGDKPFQCAQDYPECPDGYTCDGRNCVRDTSSSSGGLTVAIPKVGAPYTGPHTADPALSGGTCPSDSIGHDTSTATPLSTGPLQGLAICKPGDVNVFHATGASGPYLKVTIQYEVAHGDIDLAFIDGQGKLLGQSQPLADGTAVSNGCIALPTPVTGDVYVAVVGANNKETGSYDIKLSGSANAQTCP